MTNLNATFCLAATQRHLRHLRHFAPTSRKPAPGSSHGIKAIGFKGKPLTPWQTRSFQVHLARIYHVADSIAQAYLDQVRRVGGPPMQMLSSNPMKALHKSKHLALLLSIAKFVADNDIPVKHWFRAQFDLLRPPPHCVVIPITVCHGPNAAIRYDDWARRQESRFTHADDRGTALDSSVSKAISEAINFSHQTVLSAIPLATEFQLFSMEMFLWELFPSISAWYLVAHVGFRQDFLETGACLAPTVVEHFKQYKRDPVIKTICDRAMLASTDTLGDLPCIQSHSGLGL